MMLSVRAGALLRTFFIRCSTDSGKSRKEFPVSTVTRVEIDSVLEPPRTPTTIKVSDELSEAIDIAGVPTDFVYARHARIYRPAREATQSAWGRTKVWKVEFDNMERWENPLIGWCSTADPLSNISMAMDFTSKADAIRYCKKNNLNYEVVEPNERVVQPKTYAENFSWNKRTRITNK